MNTCGVKVAVLSLCVFYQTAQCAAEPMCYKIAARVAEKERKSASVQHNPDYPIEKRQSKDDPQQAALAHAIENGKLADIRAAVQAGADVNQEYKGYTPLGLATKQKNGEEIVHCLLALNANVDGCDSTGRPPIYIAAHNEGKDPNQNVGVVCALLNACAHADAKGPSGTTALMVATAQESVVVMGYLTQKDADMHARNLFGDTAYKIGQRKKEKEQKKLKNKGAH